VVDPDLACRPCLERSCRRKDLACLTRLSVDAVARIAGEMLDNKEGNDVGRA
jgi:hypothetical protein